MIKKGSKLHIVIDCGVEELLADGYTSDIVLTNKMTDGFKDDNVTDGDYLIEVEVIKIQKASSSVKLKSVDEIVAPEDDETIY